MAKGSRFIPWLVILALLLGVGAALVPASPVEALGVCTVWVDDDYTPATPGWGVDRFAKIQDGIDKAWCVSGRPLVNVANGTYVENVEVNKSVRLQGEDFWDTWVSAANGSLPVFEVTADNVSISGFRVTYGREGIYLLQVTDCNISNIQTNSNNTGIALAQASNCTITGIEAYTNGTGINLYESDNNTLANNYVDDNFPYAGIRLSHSDNNTLTDNEVGLQAMNTLGILVEWSSGNTLTNNYSGGNGSGINVISWSNSNTLTGNAVWGNLNHGIHIAEQSNNNQIIGNGVCGNSLKGINVEPSCSGTAINFNIIAGNGYGLYNAPSNPEVDATNNWWGANDGPSASPGSGDKVSANVDYDPWLVTGISANPTSIPLGGATSTITADMTRNSNGENTSALGHIPDGTKIIFTTDKGSIGSTTVTKYTTNGKATATLTSSSTVETATVCAEAPHGAGVPEAQYKVCTDVNFVGAAPAAPINLTASPSGWSNNNDFTVSWSNPTAPFGIVGAYYKLDSVPSSATDGSYVPGSGITSISGIAVTGNGPHQIYVWLKDGADNVDHNNRSSTTLYYDITVPAAPLISSATHPVEGTWYSNNDPSFTWTTPTDIAGIAGYSYALDKVSNTTPDTTVDSTGNSLSYTDLGGGSWYFHVRAKDSAGNWGNADHYLVNIGTPPVALDDAYSVDEDSTLSVAAPGVLGNDSDADGDQLTAVAVSTVSHGSLTLSANGSFSYTPSANFNGTDSFTYRASDGVAQSNTATVTITVVAVNDVPVAVNDAYSTNEDTALNVSAPGVLGNDSDADGDQLTAAVVSTVSHGSLTLSANGSFNYTPSANFNGTDSFTYRASDGVAQSNTATVTITVVAANDVPVAADDAYSTKEDTVLNVSAPGVLDNDSDANGDQLTAVVVSTVSHGSLTLNADGSFSYTPSANFNGTDSFTYRASDGIAQSNTATVTITVVPANDVPVAADDAYSTNEDTALSVSAPGVLGNDSDAEEDQLTAVVVSTVSHGSLTLNANGSFSYTPGANFNGTDSFTYRASDGVAQSNTATVTITVIPVNDVPVAADDAYSTNEDTALNVSAPGVLGNDSDADEDQLTAVVVSTVSHGSLTLSANGSFSYTPSANFNGTDSFTYKVNDGAADSNVATVTITVKAAPHIASLDPQLSRVDETVTVIITGTNLTGATEVDFGSGITVSFTVDSATQITASITIAAGATTGARDVSVVTPGGTGTLPDGFTVEEAAGEVGGCACSSVNKGVSARELLLGWGIIGLCWASGYYLVRRVSKRRK